MFISCICILYSTYHQMTFVDNKSKKVDTVKKKTGELISLLWFQVFEKKITNLEI